MRRRVHPILIGLGILAFSLNSAGVLAAIHGSPGDFCYPQSTHHPKDASDKPGSSHHRTDCALCQLLASTTGKIHLIIDASDEGFESYLSCLTIPDHPIHREMIRHCPARGPPIL